MTRRLFLDVSVARMNSWRCS